MAGVTEEDAVDGVRYRQMTCCDELWLGQSKEEEVYEPSLVVVNIQRFQYLPTESCLCVCFFGH